MSVASTYSGDEVDKCRCFNAAAAQFPCMVLGPSVSLEGNLQQIQSYSEPLALFYNHMSQC